MKIKKVYNWMERLLCKHDPVFIDHTIQMEAKFQCFKCGQKWAVHPFGHKLKYIKLKEKS